MSSQRLVRILIWLSLAILWGYALVPESFAEMVRWPGVIFWQLGFWLAGLALLAQTFFNPVRRLGSGLDILIGLTVGVLFISAWLAPFPRVSLWYIAMIWGYIFLGYALYNSELTATHLAYLLSGSGIASTCLGLLLWLPQRETTDFGMGYQNKLLLGHHNFVGGFLVILLPIVASLVLIEKGWKRWLWGIGSLFLLIHLYTSSSRGAILGLIFAIVTATIIFIVNVPKKKYKTILLSSLILLGIISFLSLQPRLRTLVQIQPQSAQIINLDGNANYRLTLWKTSWHIGQVKPLFGVGLGNLSRVYNFYAHEAHHGNPIANIHQAHSTFFQILAELGWVGVTLYLAWLLTLGRVWWQSFHLSRNSHNWQHTLLATGVGLSLCAYTLSSQTDFQLENIPISLGLCSSIVILLRIRDAASLQADYLKLSKAQNHILKLITPLIIISIIGVQFPLTYGMYLAYQAKHEQQNPNLAYRKLIQASIWDPDNPIYPLSAAQVLEATLRSNQVLGLAERQDLESQIIEHYRNASLAAPANDFITFNYGYWQLSRDPRAAEMTLRKALDLSLAIADQYYGYYFLGLALLRQGLTQEAVRSLALQAIVDPGYLTYPLWQSQELRGIHQQVINQALSFYTQLDPAIFSPENSSLVRWWFLNTEANIPESYRPIVRFILLWERSPAAAVPLLPLIQDPEQRVILGAWLNPESFMNAFSDYLAQASRFSPETQAQLKNYLLTEQPTLREWLATPFAVDPWSPGTIGTGLYAFRNTSLSNAFFSHHLIEKLGIPNRLRLWVPGSVYDAGIRSFLEEHRP